MKGSAEIILTDVNTGKKEIIKEDNLVTNALSKMACINVSGYCPIQKILPLKLAVCGLFVIDTKLLEDKDSFILPYNSRVLAHAGSSSNVDNVYSGSFNKSESIDLDNGYKFVWDFATHQANGTINCLSLTSSYAGNIGFGSTLEQKDLYEDYVKKINNSLIFSNYSNASFELEYKYEMIDYNRFFEFTYNSSSKSYIVNEYEFPMNEYNLRSTPLEIKQLPLSHEIQIDISDTTKTINKYVSTTEESFYLTIHEKNNDKVITHTTVYEFNKKTFQRMRKINLDLWLSMVSNSSAEWYYGVVNGNYIYILYDGNFSKIYKINLSNPNDIMEITSQIIMDNSYSACYCFFNNRLFGSNFILENDEINYINNKAKEKIKMYGTFFDELICGMPKYTDRSKFSHPQFGYNPFYLATINNLSTPINKTADKTMKVIYTITNT